MANSVFRDVIDFMGKLGIYDVLLPFLLTFVMSFAILEKSRVFGTETYKGDKVSRKNLNAIASFCIGFLVVGSGQLVSIINQAVAQTMVLLIIGVLFMVLVGAFHEEGTLMSLSGWWKTGAMLIMAIGIIGIFLNAITLKSGVSVLEFIYDYVISNATGTVVGTVVLLLILFGAMAFIVWEKKED